MDDFLDQEDMNVLFDKLSQAQNGLEKKFFSAKIIKPGILLISVEGRILGQNDSLNIIDQLSNITAKNDLRITIDLSNCTYLSSMVLGALARVAEKSINAGKKICVFGANEIIVDLLKLTMFTEFIEICDSLEMSINFLNSN